MWSHACERGSGLKDSGCSPTEAMVVVCPTEEWYPPIKGLPEAPGNDEKRNSSV